MADQDKNARVEKAKELFSQGYNCAQAVFSVFNDETGLDPNLALRLSAPFGGGMARMREVCGAVSGMFMAAGALYGYDQEADPENKAAHYRLIQELAQKFREQNGSIICRELLGLEKRQNPLFRKNGLLSITKNGLVSSWSVVPLRFLIITFVSSKKTGTALFRKNKFIL